MSKKFRKSLTWLSPGKIKLIEKEIPKVSDDEVLVEVKACAICGSDLRIREFGNNRVESGQTIGHEVSGKVTEIGDNVKKFKLNDRVSIGADIPCGKCTYCSNGMPNCCETNLAIGHQLEGGFSEYILLNSSTVNEGPVHKISSDISYEEAALAEPLACCLNGYEVSSVKKGSHIVIFGAGSIGLMLSILGKVYAAQSVTLIDINKNKLNLVKEINKEVNLIDSRKNNIKKEILKITDQKGADVVFIACSSTKAQEDGIKILAKKGCINFFAGVSDNSPLLNIDSNLVHYGEICITGSHGSTPKQHRLALKLIENHKVDIKKLITHRFSLNNVLEGYKMAASDESVKVVIKPGMGNKN